MDWKEYVKKQLTKVAIIKHENEWWWGKSYTYITSNGKASITLSTRNDYPDWGWITSLTVHKSIRSQKVGTMLIAMVEEEARNMGITSIGLGANKSQWVKQWYERLGFSEYEIDEESKGIVVNMKKDL